MGRKISAQRLLMRVVCGTIMLRVQVKPRAEVGPLTLFLVRQIPRNIQKFQKIRRVWQILYHIGLDFGCIELYIPSIPEVFQCITCKNLFLVQYFR